MFRKELMKAGLIATISLLCLTGCSGQEKPTPNETTSVETETDGGETDEGETDEGETGKEPQETTTGEEVIGKFDPADVCKNISIDGRIVEFPWTLNKLGDEYEFDDVLTGNPDDQISGAYLLHKGEKFILVNIGDEIGDRDSPIVVMSYKISNNISVYGFGRGTTKEDVTMFERSGSFEAMKLYNAIMTEYGWMFALAGVDMAKFNHYNIEFREIRDAYSDMSSKMYDAERIDRNLNGFITREEIKLNVKEVKNSEKAQKYDPLILDLNRNGKYTSDAVNGVHFDYSGDGFAEKTAWVESGDGLLVYDKNGNGIIDDGNELFGDKTVMQDGTVAANGFSALKDFDSKDENGNVIARKSSVTYEDGTVGGMAELDFDIISEDTVLKTDIEISDDIKNNCVISFNRNAA